MLGALWSRETAIQVCLPSGYSDGCSHRRSGVELLSTRRAGRLSRALRLQARSHCPPHRRIHEGFSGAPHLKREEYASGNALESAKSDYRTVSRTRQIKDALPVAWQQIVRDQDELLVDLIAERVATICGFKPEPEVVADFIQRLSTASTPLPQPAAPPQTATARQPTLPPTVHVLPAEQQFSGFTLNGQPYNEGSAIDTLMRAFEVLSARDSNFLERYAALPKHGRKRRYLSRNKMELYPGRPDLCEEYSVSRFGGWWIGTELLVVQLSGTRLRLLAK